MATNHLQRPQYAQEAAVATGMRVPGAIAFHEKTQRSFSGVLAVGFLGLAIAGALAWAFFVRDGAKADVMAAAHRVADALRTGKCAETPAISRNGVSPAAALEALRGELAATGLAWDHVAPLAFGGVHALVDRNGQREDTVVGDLYFNADGKIYCVSLSFVRAEDGYRLSEVWQGGVADCPADQIKARASTRYDQFKTERRNAGDESQVLRPKFLFVAL